MADIDEEAFFHGTTTNNNAEHPIPTGRPLDPWARAMLMTKALVIAVGASLLAMMFAASAFASNAREATEFSAHLAGFQGLNNATPGHTVSPMFSIKLRAENPHAVVQPWCYNGGDAVVSYSGVALAWGQVPRFCVTKRMVPTDVTVLLWGREVGLSEDLRQRFALEWNASTAQVDVEMKLFYEDRGFSSADQSNGPVLLSFPLMLRH